MSVVVISQQAKLLEVLYWQFKMVLSGTKKQLEMFLDPPLSFYHGCEDSWCHTTGSTLFAVLRIRRRSEE